MIFQNHPKYYIEEWVRESFPKNYQELTYIEPVCSTTNILFGKQFSKEEIINDSDKDLILTLRIIRDQADIFLKHLRKLNYTKKAFGDAVLTKEFPSEVSHAINEFVLRKLSKDGDKQTFIPTKSKTSDLKFLLSASERLKNVLIFNESPVKVLQTFNDPTTLVYISPKALPEQSEFSNEYEAILNNHIQLADVLKNFKGPAIVNSQPSRLYSKLYKSWRCDKKQFELKNKILKTELLWMNF